MVKVIDFKRIKGQILTDIINPLKIVPAEIFLNAYRQKVRSNGSDSNELRGMQYFKLACGSNLIIENNGSV